MEHHVLPQAHETKFVSVPRETWPTEQPEKLKVVIIHYHFRPGGVTRVIERAVESLKDKIDFFCISGEALKNDEALFSTSGVFQPLEYSGQTDFPNLEKQVAEIKKQAADFFGREPDLWHIHNHSLGKNGFLPLLTKALADSGCRLLLQPHDFAEDGRGENYRLLTEALGPNKNSLLYPDAENISYAPINHRDKTFLKTIGLKQVQILPNSITAHPNSISGYTEKTVVYPARAIRRKNLGEFLLWSLLAPEGYLFQSTLAPQNPKWQGFYDDWVHFAEELNLPVEFDAGRKHDFPELIQQAETLMTTSIQEGFGLAFLEPWLEGKNLIGRNLPEITTDFEEEGLNLSGLYISLPVPVGWVGVDDFVETLETTMRAAYSAYSKSWSAGYLDDARSALVIDGKIDFGVLNEQFQRRIIRHLINHPEDRTMLPDFSPAPSSALIEENRKVVQERYSQSMYRKRLLEIYHQLAAKKPSSISFGNADQLLDLFLKPGRFSLLRT